MSEAPSFEKGGRKGFDPGIETSRREKYRELSVQYEKENSEAVLSIKTNLQRIDFSELSSILAEEAKKSGVRAEDFNFVSPEHIYIIDPGYFSPPTRPMIFGGVENAIIMNGNLVPVLSQAGFSERDIAVVLFRSMCHEYAHATGVLRDTTNSENRESRFQTGYLQIGTYEGYGFQVEGSRLFNEGVTELIARRVAETYLSRKPLSLPDGSQLNLVSYRKFLEKKVPGWPVDEKSQMAYVFAERLCEHLASLCGVEVEKVREGLIAGYFNHAVSPELNELLEETIGDGFSIALGDVETIEQFKNVAEEYEFPIPPQSTRERIKEFMLNLIKNF